MAAKMALTGKTIVYLVNEADFFISHRLHIALEAKKAGANIHIIAPANKKARKSLENNGLIYHNIELSRKGINPTQEINSIRQIRELYEKLSPDLVHHITIKPVLYGSIATRFSKVPTVINAITGLGYVYVNKSIKARIIRKLVETLYTFAFKHPNLTTIFQNNDNLNYFVKQNLVKRSNSVLIKGSGVDMEQFKPTSEPKSKIPTIALISRMLWDKGVGEFVTAAKQLKGQAKFILVGNSDEKNPAGIAKSQLEEWHKDGIIEWLGHKDNIANIIEKSHIICLPSYGEGLPRVLIEAAACARPIITTDTFGCRDMINNGKNGILVPTRNSKELKKAIEKLIENPELRQKMGTEGRKMVESEFSIATISKKTIELYKQKLT